MNNFIEKNIRVPQSFNGTFFKLISHEVDTSDNNIKASCVLCRDEKSHTFRIFKTYDKLSTSYKGISNNQF